MAKTKTEGAKRVQLVNADTGVVVASRLEIADTSWRRAVGLIGRAAFEPGGGLWLHPCNGIHTFGVRFSIDVIFLDGQGRAMRLAGEVAPCRVCGPVRHARAVVELPAGTLAKLGLEAGARLEVVKES